MYPLLLDWGPLVLPAWHTLFVVGALAAFWLLLRLGRRFFPDIEPRDLACLFAICYVLGYFGARALSIFVEEPDTRGFGDSALALLRFGPMTFYGGAIAAFVGGTVFVLMTRLPFADLFDIGIPSAFIALALGRVGCFLNGDDYGSAAPLTNGAPPWWAVTFPSLKDGIARYPVQLMESGSVLLITFGLIAAFAWLRRTFRPGAVGFVGVVLYANLRFLLEFLRDDFRGSPFGNWMSTSQFISILVLAVCALSVPFWIFKSKSKGFEVKT